MDKKEMEPDGNIQWRFIVAKSSSVADNNKIEKKKIS